MSSFSHAFFFYVRCMYVRAQIIEKCFFFYFIKKHIEPISTTWHDMNDI